MSITVEVQVLGAPWPAGTNVGSRVELKGHEAIPAWAVGKCKIVQQAEPLVTLEVATPAPTATPDPTKK